MDYILRQAVFIAWHEALYPACNRRVWNDSALITISRGDRPVALYLLSLK